MTRVPHHIMIGDTPWCDWSGCQAGRDIMTKIGQHITCGQPSGAAARRAAQALRPHFRKGAVKVVAGHCTHDARMAA